MKRFSSLLVFAFIFIGLVASATPVYANHSWGNYHWARIANPFTLKTIDSVTSGWDSYLTTTINDWTLSSVLNLTRENGSTTTNDRRRCSAVAGKIHVCNYTYGKNGWLGIAQIWASGNHITQATTKVNDSYFNAAPYNIAAWKNLVMCQEVGHDFGLDHQDEAFDNPNLNTCMDYTNNPTSNQHPNQHDYDQLEAIYAHLDSVTTVAASAAATAGSDIDTSDPQERGRLVRESGRSSVYERDLGKGVKIITHVFWAEDGHGDEHKPEKK